MLLVCISLFVTACAGFDERAASELEAKPGSRILAIGDSIVWWNAGDESSIAAGISRELGEPVVNLAVPGAALSHPDPAAAAEGLDIRAQFRERGWDWVVLDGGANDLGEEGKAAGCASVLDDLVSVDAMDGELPGLVKRIRATGARVVLLGYYELPEVSRDGFCGDSLRQLAARTSAFAAGQPGVEFVPMDAVVRPDRRASYDPDLVHPSAASSLEIGRRVGQVIRAAEARER